MREVAEITPFVFFEYKLPGFNDADRDNKVFLRRVCEILIMPHIEKNANFNISKFLPIHGDKQSSAITEVLSDNNVDQMLANLEKKRKEKKQ